MFLDTSESDRQPLSVKKDIRPSGFQNIANVLLRRIKATQTVEKPVRDPRLANLMVGMTFFADFSKVDVPLFQARGIVEVIIKGPLEGSWQVVPKVPLEGDDKFSYYVDKKLIWQREEDALSNTDTSHAIYFVEPRGNA